MGGANGSGKTTVSLTLLPRFLQVFEYVNADSIASGLSPLNPESMAMQNGLRAEGIIKSYIIRVLCGSKRQGGLLNQWLMRTIHS